MSEKEKATESAAVEVKTETKKVLGRGIATAKGPSRLKFSEKDAMPQTGLFLAHLESVVLSNITIGEDTTGMPSFNGLEIPKLTLTFASNESDASKRKYATLSFTAVESNVETIPFGKKSWQVDRIMDWFKHLMNVYVVKGVREFTEEEAQALSLPFVDFDENNGYVPVDPEVVIAGWRTLFENFENIFNRGGKDGKPVYKTSDGKAIAVWLKLLRFVKRNKKWSPVASGNQAGALVIPSFIGEGCIEIYKANEVPAIRLNAMTESIIPREIEAPKQPTPIGGGVPMGGVPMPGDIPMGDYTGIETSAAEDLPF